MAASGIDIAVLRRQRQLLAGTANGAPSALTPTPMASSPMPSNPTVMRALTPTAPQPLSPVTPDPVSPVAAAPAAANFTTNTKPTLPANYGFNDLANYEETRRNDFAKSVQSQLADRRTALAKSLSEQGKASFAQATPGIMEDLNRRGVYNSSTAVANATADALKQIELENNKQLTEFDNSATSASLQAQQDALDASLGIRRSELESKLQEGQAASEQAMAERLADKSSRNNLNNALIGGGASLLGGALSGGSNSLVAGLFSKAAPLAGVAAASGAGAGGIPLASAAGTGAAGIGLGTVGAIGAAGLGAALLDTATERKLKEKYGNTTANIVSPLINPVGSTINFTKDLVSNPSATLNKVFGGGKKDAVVNLPAWNIPDLPLPVNPSAAQAVKAVYEKPLGAAGSYHEGEVYDAVGRLQQLEKLQQSGVITPDEFKTYAAPLALRARQSTYTIASSGSTAANSVGPVIPEVMRFFNLFQG